MPLHSLQLNGLGITRHHCRAAPPLSPSGSVLIVEMDLNRVELSGEASLVVRNQHQIARIIPNTVHLTAIEAMADLYQTLSDDAASGWLQDGRQPLGGHGQESGGQGAVDEMRDPWDS